MSEEDFDAVRRLLRWKRYEQPPPGYFNSFSAKVIARIQAEDSATFSSWWSWLVERFDDKPVLVGAYGLALSGLLFCGFWLSQAFQAEAMAGPTLTGSFLAATPGSPLALSEFTRSTAWDHVDPLLPRPRQVLRTDPLHLSSPIDSLRLEPVNYQLDNP